MSAQTPREVPHNAVTMDQQNVKLGALLTILTVAAILGVYYKTTWSMIEIWERSDTFAHGFLIFPFSAYLIWGQRKYLSAFQPQPNLMGLLVLAALGFSWLLATLASVLVLEQFFLITMIPAVVWTILGSRIVRELAFPLVYLLLAVPFGEALIPPLIDFTADFTVKALQLTGIPVYREGSFFYHPERELVCGRSLQRLAIPHRLLYLGHVIRLFDLPQPGASVGVRCTVVNRAHFGQRHPRVSHRNDWSFKRHELGGRGRSSHLWLDLLWFRDDVVVLDRLYLA